MATRQQVAAHSLSDVEHGLADHPDGDQVVHCRVRVARREHAVAQLRGVEVVEAEFHRRIYLAHQDLVGRKLIVLLRRRPANGHVATIVLDRALAGLAHARKRRHPAASRLCLIAWANLVRYASQAVRRHRRVYLRIGDFFPEREKSPKRCASLANPANSLSGSVGLHPGAGTTPSPARCRRVRVGHEGHEVHSLPTDDAAAEHVRVLAQGPLGPHAPRGPHV